MGGGGGVTFYVLMGCLFPLFLGEGDRFRSRVVDWSVDTDWLTGRSMLIGRSILIGQLVDRVILMGLSVGSM